MLRQRCCGKVVAARCCVKLFCRDVCFLMRRAPSSFAPAPPHPPTHNLHMYNVHTHPIAHAPRPPIPTHMYTAQTDDEGNYEVAEREGDPEIYPNLPQGIIRDSPRFDSSYDRGRSMKVRFGRAQLAGLSLSLSLSFSLSLSLFLSRSLSLSLSLSLSPCL